MNKNHNNNQNNKHINSSNLKIQLRNYSGINPKSLALHGFDGIHDDMKERNIKRKERMRDVMDDGICQNQRVLSCKFPLLLP